MPLHLTPLDNNFAFEVQGLDIWSGLDDGQVRSLDDAWANQGVLVFRRQSLSEEELVTFSRRFGTPDVIVRTDWASKGRPEVTQISNMRNADGTYDWWARVGRAQLAHRSILRGRAGHGRHPLWRRGAGGRTAHLLGQPAARLRSTPARDQGADRRPARYLQLRRTVQGLQRRERAQRRNPGADA